MPDPRPTLLLTRPEPASHRFAAAFRDRFGFDWPVVVSPLLTIVPISAQIPKADEVIFTSENAVAPFVAASPARGRKAWCVGDRTGQAAKAAGFAVTSGPGDAARLLPMILAGHRGGRLLHARGRHVAAHLAADLSSAGLETLEVVVYDQQPLPLSPEAQALLVGAAPVLVPLFSPRSARLFAHAAQGCSAPLWLAPISAAAAAPCPGAARVEVARRPDADAVLEALARLIVSGNAG